MTSRVDEILAKIPVLKTNLADIVDFKDKCVDPLAIEIIAESVNYALETSVRRLESVAKINPSIRDTAIETILPAVKTLGEIIKEAPACPTSALGTAPPKPPPTKPRVRAKKGAPGLKSRPEKPGDIVETLTEVVTKTKAGTRSSREKELLAKLTPEEQKTLRNVRVKNPAVYDGIIEGMLEGKTSLEAFAAMELPVKTERIQRGKQFTITYDGNERKYMVVEPKLVALSEQVPEEPGVLKIADTAPLSKLAEGKKAGETFPVKIGGKEYKATIKEVKEGYIKSPESKGEE